MISSVKSFLVPKGTNLLHPLLLWFSSLYAGHTSVGYGLRVAPFARARGSRTRAETKRGGKVLWWLYLVEWGFLDRLARLLLVVTETECGGQGASLSAPRPRD